MTDDDRCNICKNEQETLEHTFINCPFTKILWNDIELFLTQKLNHTLKLNVAEKLFGVLDGSKALNHILTLTRKHIYFCKQRERKPDIHDLKGYIAQIIRLEKYNAKITQSFNIFENKWKDFL